MNAGWAPISEDRIMLADPTRAESPQHGILWREMGICAWQDWAELRRSRWAAFCVIVYLALAAGFMLAATHESSVFGFTGMGRVLFSFSHALLLVLPLLALSATAPALSQARDNGSLELWFSQPLSRPGYFLGLTCSRWLVLALPLVVLQTGMALWGWLAFGDGTVWFFFVRSLAISLTLLWAFTGLGLWAAVRTHSQAQALLWTLLLWALGVALLDFALIGLLLAWRVPAVLVFFLAALNPVECARLALLSAADPSLATLGPVGFFLFTNLGAGALLALGLAWPLLAGSLAWRLAMDRFCNGDLV